MALSSILVSLALALPAIAIPPPDFGFPEAPNDTALTIRFQGSDVVVQEAALYGINIPQSVPTLSVNTSNYRSLANYNGSYTVLMVDPDASYPETPTSRFILHWMQPNFTQANSTMMPSGRTLQNATAPAVPYMRPAPPTNSSAHRYIIYAFQQPLNFTIPSQWSGLSSSNRTRFNLTNFISDTGLGTPAAANYFYVSNQTSVPANFTAAPGGTYPGGDGTAVTSGDPYRSSTAASSSASSGTGSTTSTASTSSAGSGSAGTTPGAAGSSAAGASASGTSSGAAAAMITGVGTLLGAGIVGMAALL